MEVKKRQNAQRLSLLNRTHEALRPCPFCGMPVLSRVASSGKRFFDCPGCGACISFDDADYALVIWNQRV